MENLLSVDGKQAREDTLGEASALCAWSMGFQVYQGGWKLTRTMTCGVSSVSNIGETQ